MALVGKLRKTGLWLVAMMLVAVGLVSLGPAPKAEALSGNEFDPGYIISDLLFYDSNAMSQAEIQNFLNAKIGACSTTSCLNVATFATTARPASISDTTGNVRCNAYSPAPVESAASIIFKVQQACGISAKVILVTLQKEQALVTAKGPSQAALDRAMGYACPDTGTCTVLGFDAQIYFGARQLNTYKASRFGMQPGSRSVLYHPNTSCGSSVVNVRNYATAALYNYTPYQPNAAALANLSGGGDGCSAFGNRNFWVFYNNWFGSTTGVINPIGDVNSVTPVVGGAAIRGWVFDPDVVGPIQTHVYVDGAYRATVAADQERLDVEQAYPGRGANHGFFATLPIPEGPHSVCIYGINEGPGINVLIGCRAVTVAAGANPQGGINEMNVTASREGLFIRGFVFDADTPSPILADVWVNGAYRTTFVADKPRPDVQSAFPAQGPNHGFAAEIALGPGTSTVCIYGINTGGGSINTLLGCRNIVVVQPGASPIGDINGVINTGKEAAVWGWSFDFDTQDSILVDVWVNGSYRQTLQANQSRPDVQQTYPGQSVTHGFGTMVSLSPGVNNMCFYGINVGGGNHTLLGCRVVARVVNSPVGSVNGLVGVANAVSTYGWVVDADTADPVLADVWINGAYAATLVAVAPRPDVAAVYPALGENHGFGAVIPATPGIKSVCIYGIDVGGSNHTLLGCKTVTVMP